METSGNPLITSAPQSGGDAEATAVRTGPDPRRWWALALLCGLARSPAALLAARVVQGSAPRS
jgi:hypothetical protein